jgi:hypothetical protein
MSSEAGGGGKALTGVRFLRKASKPVAVVPLLLSSSVGVGLRLDSKASLACLTIAGVSSTGLLVLAMVLLLALRSSGDSPFFGKRIVGLMGQ